MHVCVQRTHADAARWPRTCCACGSRAAAYDMRASMCVILPYTQMMREQENIIVLCEKGHPLELVHSLVCVQVDVLYYRVFICVCASILVRSDDVCARVQSSKTCVGCGRSDCVVDCRCVSCRCARAISHRDSCDNYACCSRVRARVGMLCVHASPLDAV
jgi:hypothetical protein